MQCKMNLLNKIELPSHMKYLCTLVAICVEMIEIVDKIDIFNCLRWKLKNKNYSVICYRRNSSLRLIPQGNVVSWLGYSVTSGTSEKT